MRRRGLSSCLVSSEGKEILHYSTHQGHGSITEDTIALRLLEQMRRYGQLSDSWTEFWVWETYDATVEVNFQCFKAGSQTSVSEGAACLKLLQCLWESCQTRTRSVLLPFSRPKRGFAFETQAQCCSFSAWGAVPRCSATQSQQSWERGVGGPLINIQPLSASTHTHTHTQTLAIPRIYTNSPSCICKHKPANKQTRINVCAYLHIFLIGIVRAVFRLTSDLRTTLFTRLLAQYGLPLLSQADI